MRPWRAGVALALALAPLTWALALLVERATRPEPDPVAVVWAERSPFIGRALVAGYVSVALATMLTALGRRWRAVRGERAWQAALALGAVGAVVQVVAWR